MRRSYVSRTLVVAATLSTALSAAPAALAVSSDHGDGNGQYSERESYSEHESEQYCEGPNGCDEPSWAERMYEDRKHYHHEGRHNDPTSWHFADPYHGDFDYRHGPGHGDHHHHGDYRHHHGPRAGDGGNGGDD